MPTTIVLVSDTRPGLGRVITFGSGGDYSHGEIRDKEKDRGFGARAFGVRWYPGWCREYEHPWIRLEEWALTIPQVDQDRALDATVAKCGGRPYAFGQLLNTAWVYGAARLGVKVDIDITKYWVCSEVIWEYLVACRGKIAELVLAIAPYKDNFPPDARPPIMRRELTAHGVLAWLGDEGLATLVRRRETA